MTPVWTVAALHDNKTMNECTHCSNSNLQFLCEYPIRQSNHDVGKVTPVRGTKCGYVAYSSLNNWNHVFADVILQYRLTPVPPSLYKNNIKTHTCIYGQKNRKFHTHSVAKLSAHQSLKMWHRFSTISHLCLLSIMYIWKVGVASPAVTVGKKADSVHLQLGIN